MFCGNSYLVLFLKGIFWAGQQNMNVTFVAFLIPYVSWERTLLLLRSNAAFTEAGLTDEFMPNHKH